MEFHRSHDFSLIALKSVVFLLNIPIFKHRNDNRFSLSPENVINLRSIGSLKYLKSYYKRHHVLNIDVFQLANFNFISGILCSIVNFENPQRL